jgi:hypothetical protein
MNADTRLYINCMEEIRDRVNLVQSVGTGQTTTGRQVFDVELVFLQLRKILELIAYASLTANKEKYAAAHAQFAKHWRAKSMLQELEKINPDFYPMPIGQPQLQPNGVNHFPVVVDGFLTKEDFALLYDKTSDILHVGNPFGVQAPKLNIKCSVKDWLSRIQTLLRLHIMHLVDDKKWIVEIPESGAIHLSRAEPYENGIEQPAQRR